LLLRGPRSRQPGGVPRPRHRTSAGTSAESRTIDGILPPPSRPAARDADAEDIDLRQTTDGRGRPQRRDLRSHPSLRFSRWRPGRRGQAHPSSRCLTANPLASAFGARAKSEPAGIG